MTRTALDLAAGGMVGLSRESLIALRDGLLRDSPQSAASILQEAGFAGGARVYDAFRGWVAAHGGPEPHACSLAAFQRTAAEFFRHTGWGELTIGDLHGTVLTLDAPDWSEATPDAALAAPCCFLSSGMLAVFFGYVAEAPLAVMEVECRSAGADRCRFLLGSAEVMQAVYDEMSNGTPYDAAVGAAA